MISVVVPLYNEEEVLGESYRRLTAVMQDTGEEYELIFVNDGSRDKTASIAAQLAEKDANVRLISFARNFGHQIAITCGMDHASGDAIVVIDADLQDPPELIPKMIAKWREGNDVVYGKRTRRRGETAFKKITALLYYRFLKHMTSVDIPTDTGDFRLIDRKVCDAMKRMGEHNRYVRGLVSWVGFRQCAIEYVRDERLAGKTKYSLKKMLRLAGDGIASFSYKPLALASWLGSIVCIGSLAAFIIFLFAADMLTLTSVLCFLSLFVSGISLLAIGILGVYIGRIYEESKNRPLYIIREKIGF